jgi:hypothetical protein
MSSLGSAVISDDGVYRYRLSRSWLGEGGAVLFVCLNPSTADAARDDATVRRMIGFARAWGHRELLVGNLFAYRATDPRELRKLKDPIGPENAEHLAAMAAAAERIVAAWGADWMIRQGSSIYARSRALRSWPLRVWELLSEHGTVECLGTTRGGHPRHPLRLAGDTPLEPLAGKYRPQPEPELYCRCGHSWEDHELLLAGRQKARNGILVDHEDLGACGAAVRPRVRHRADDDTRNLRCLCERFAVPRDADRTDDEEFLYGEDRPVMRSLRKPDLAVVS